MAGKRPNALRAFHLLVVREGPAYSWEIRYDRHARPVSRSTETYRSHHDAERAGRSALAVLTGYTAPGA